VLDTEKEEVEEVEMPVRGIFRVKDPSEDDIEEIPKYSIVKVIITSRDTDLEKLKESLNKFDSYIIIEQYKNKRKKVGLIQHGGLDLSIDNLLKIYSKEKDISYSDLKSALEFID